MVAGREGNARRRGRDRRDLEIVDAILDAIAGALVFELRVNWTACTANVANLPYSARKEHGSVQPVGIPFLLLAVTTLKAVSLPVSNIRPDSEKKDVRLLQLVPVAGDISASMPKDDDEGDGPSREKYEPGLNITAKLVPVDENNYHGRRLQASPQTLPTATDLWSRRRPAHPHARRVLRRQAAQGRLSLHLRPRRRGRKATCPPRPAHLLTTHPYLSRSRRTPPSPGTGTARTPSTGAPSTRAANP